MSTLFLHNIFLHKLLSKPIEVINALMLNDDADDDTHVAEQRSRKSTSMAF